MTKQKVFVFRISKGNESGKPMGRCPLDYREIQKKIDKLTKSDIKVIDYDNNGYLEFLHDEFWKNHTLRQGWGIENLDLKQDVHSWIENYMLSGKIYWNAKIECSEAKGRWNIVSRMLKMKQNDVLLIPKTSSRVRLNDYGRFTVCQVAEEYYFDYPAGVQDFGHCLKVKNIKEFKYGKSTLERGDFGSPYLWAVTEVKDYHSRYKKIRDFVAREFNVNI